MDSRRKHRIYSEEKRDNEKVNQALNKLKEVASGDKNTMPAFIDCVEAYATLGEICDVLRGVFGEQEEILVI